MQIIKQTIFWIGLIHIFDGMLNFFTIIFTEKAIVEWVAQADRGLLVAFGIAYILLIIYFAFLSNKLTK